MALARLVKALEKMFLPKIEHLYVLLKNDLRMALGRLVKALENFFVIVRGIWSTTNRSPLFGLHDMLDFWKKIL